MPVGRKHGGYSNQAGSFAPIVSPWGQALQNGLGSLIDQPAPIGWRRHNFGGTVGGLTTVSASVIPIFTQPGYFGDVPQTEQATVDAPPPWKR